MVTWPGVSARGLGLAVACATLVLDQLSKLWLYYGVELQRGQPWEITGFLDFVLVWNFGISYGLFQQTTEAGRGALIVFKLGAAVILAVWLSRAQGRALALGLGLIIGGAVGNAVDRLHFGAVMDFVHLHWGTFSWYVFNLADAAIVVGVLFLLYDSVQPARPKASSLPQSDARPTE